MTGIITRSDLLPGHADEQYGGQFATDGTTMGPGPNMKSQELRRIGRRSSAGGVLE